MIILLFIFALVRHLQGAPTAIPSIPGCDPPDIFVRDDPMNKHLGTRGINDIVISCLATIFACTWTAIHTNIPGQCDSGWEIFKRQVTTMIYAILAPEAITAWALRQHLAARRIVRVYNEEVVKIPVTPQDPSLFEKFKESVKGGFDRKPPPRLIKEGEVVPWTITHGFFEQMGGFVMYEDGRPVQVMADVRWRVLYSETPVDAPRITEAEIQDRSKGDGLSKTIVILQTTWFIAQCIVRWSSSLPVTELEVLTLGFAMLNALTYALWWNKPQSVRLPVYLEMKARVGGSATEQPDAAVGEGERQAEEQDEPTGNQTVAAPIKEEPPLAKRSYLSERLENDRDTGWQLFWRIPFVLVQAFLRPLSRMMDYSLTAVRKGELRVPMFFSYKADSAVVYIALSAIASIFGLIHLIPSWFLDFPSRSEMLLWRTSAGIITVEPILLGLWAKKTHENNIITSSARSTPLGIITVFGLPLYLIARLTLILLALLSLRNLHEDALVANEWLSFIPHL